MSSASAGPPSSERGHLALRLPAELAELALCSALIAAAESDPRWSRLSLIVPYRSAALLVDDEPASLSAGAAEVVRIGTGREERAALERLRPDAIALLDHGFGSAWKAWRARVPIRAGLALGARRWLLTHSASPPSRAGRALPTPLAHLARDVGGLLQLATTSLHPRFEVGEERAAGAAARLAELGIESGAPYWICVPAAGPLDSDLWPIEHYVALLQGLIEARRGQLLLLGWLPEHEPVNAAISAASGLPGTSLQLAAHELGLFAPLAARARGWIGGARAPSALAAAAGVPCLCLFGPTERIERLPVSAFAAGLQLGQLDCAPCGEARCPLEHRRCMSELGPGRALATLIALIEEREAAELDASAESELEVRA